MKQKLSLCCALINDPDLLILDEPTTGVDPLSRGQFEELIEYDPGATHEYERDGLDRLYGRGSAVEKLADGDQRLAKFVAEAVEGSGKCGETEISRKRHRPLRESETAKIIKRWFCVRSRRRRAQSRRSKPKA